jgi:hypothetical protein
MIHSIPIHSLCERLGDLAMEAHFSGDILLIETF